MATIQRKYVDNDNVIPYLDMLAMSEIGAEMLAASDDGYNVLVGSVPGAIRTFDSYAKHPDVFNKAEHSSAAGRYQILYLYWPYYQKQLRLPDFGKLSQDRYAIQQLEECHALPFLANGNLAGAIACTAHIWSSLPGNRYGQHPHSMNWLKDAFTAAGGQLS
jgi:muramidase (phage lysozyme)